MKIKKDLYFQFTEYDCGAFAWINAINSLFEQKEIPPDLIKNIFHYSLDEYHNKKAYHGGTSPAAMTFISEWLNNYAEECIFPIQCEHLVDEQVVIEKNSYIHKHLMNGGVCIARVMMNGLAHYICITHVDELEVYIFDSYLCEKTKNILLIEEKQYNRVLSLEEFNSQQSNELCLGTLDFRHIFLVTKS